MMDSAIQLGRILLENGRYGYVWVVEGTAMTDVEKDYELVESMVDYYVLVNKAHFLDAIEEAKDDIFDNRDPRDLATEVVLINATHLFRETI